VAYPYGDAMPFYTYKKLCMERENAKKGFYVTLEYERNNLLSGSDVEVTVLYEWADNNKETTVVLKPGSKSKVIGPISVLNCISLTRKQYETFSGLLMVNVAKNEFNGFAR
jgi:hypothetical protein